MKPIHLCAAVTGTALIAAAVFSNRSQAIAAEHDAAPTFPCLNPPTMSGTFPGDTPISDQQSFNCFAWSEFIAANWPTTGGGAAAFGAPRDMSPVVWETYMNVHDLLNDAGTAPPPWGGTAEGAQTPVGNSGARILSRTAKLNENFNPSKDINEAAPGIAWLADTDGNLVWYEIMVNEAEYNYFVQTGYYNAARQQEALASEGRAELPMGTFDATTGGTPGAAEFKAAWLAVPDPDNEKWARYKLSEGLFCTEIGEPDETCESQIIALIGLHILHKTTSQPSWTWATFEHMDNVPDDAAVAGGQAPDRAYNFYDAACTPRAVPDSCTGNKASAPATTTCTPNTPPAYKLGAFVGNKVDPASACQPYPIQATRVFPLPDTNENPIVDTNAAAQRLIASANPDSVFQYYQLINVLWADSPVNENALPKGATSSPAPHAPLSKTAFRPDLNAFPVANPVLETYVQSTSCLECHSGATIAGEGAIFASDYSFIFGMAGGGK